MQTFGKIALSLSMALGVWLVAAQLRAEPPETDVDRLITQLGDDDYFVRERAEQELAKMGLEVFDAISAATSSKDLEISARARYVLRLIQINVAGEDDLPQVKQLLSDYHLKSTTARLAVMQKLSALPDGQGVPALCRLALLEESETLSKWAAMKLIAGQGLGNPADKKLAEVVRKNLFSSRREAAKWLHVWLQFADDPKTATVQWSKLADGERSLLRSSPGNTSSAIVATMFRLQIVWLDKLGRADESLAAMRKLIELDWSLEDDPPQVKRLLSNYRRRKTGSRLAVMKALAALPNKMGVAALCRFVRFENSPLLSKHAALLLIGHRWASNPPDKKMAALVRKNLAGSKRDPAKWLLTSLQFADNPNMAVDDWAKLVEKESALLDKASGTLTNPQIVTAMLRLQIDWLTELDRRPDAVVVLQKLVELEDGDPKTLTPLLKCLIKQKAWAIVEQLATRFASRFDGNAALLYMLAEARLKAGNQEKADETARQALKANPGLQPGRLETHLLTAYQLQRRGLFNWAKLEYLYVSGTAPKGHLLRIYAQAALSEMLYDQEDCLGAAKALEKTVADMERIQLHPATPGRRTPAEDRSRMYYFFACHWKARGDADKHRDYLYKARDAYPADIDVLIALYKLPKQSKEQLKKTRALIKSAAAALHEQAKQTPADPAPHNQYAWLIGNTEGDFEEALKSSRKSIALQPDSGGYYDTLAHVYFGKGDFENAVRYQEKATTLQPHSGLINRKLEVFRKKLQESKKVKEMPSDGQ